MVLECCIPNPKIVQMTPTAASHKVWSGGIYQLPGWNSAQRQAGGFIRQWDSRTGQSPDWTVLIPPEVAPAYEGPDYLPKTTQLLDYHPGLNQLLVRIDSLSGAIAVPGGIGTQAYTSKAGLQLYDALNGALLREWWYNPVIGNPLSWPSVGNAFFRKDGNIIGILAGGFQTEDDYTLFFLLDNTTLATLQTIDRNDTYLVQQGFDDPNPNPNPNLLRSGEYFYATDRNNNFYLGRVGVGKIIKWDSDFDPVTGESWPYVIPETILEVTVPPDYTDTGVGLCSMAFDHDNEMILCSIPIRIRVPPGLFFGAQINEAQLTRLSATGSVLAGPVVVNPSGSDRYFDNGNVVALRSDMAVLSGTTGSGNTISSGLTRFDLSTLEPLSYTRVGTTELPAPLTDYGLSSVRFVGSLGPVNSEKIWIARNSDNDAISFIDLANSAREIADDPDDPRHNGYPGPTQNVALFPEGKLLSEPGPEHLRA